MLEWKSSGTPLYQQSPKQHDTLKLCKAVEKCSEEEIKTTAIIKHGKKRKAGITRRTDDGLKSYSQGKWIEGNGMEKNLSLITNEIIGEISSSGLGILRRW